MSFKSKTQQKRKVTEIFDLNHRIFIPRYSEINQRIEDIKNSREDYFIGDEAVKLLFEKIAQYGFNYVLATDGIDELMGGYWSHKKEEDFIFFFARLWSAHLEPLLESAKEVGVTVLFPYLDFRFTDFITREIPTYEKTRGKGRKRIWKKLALKYLPKEIVERKKLGECDALSLVRSK